MNMPSPPPDLDGQPLELLIKFMRMTGAEDNIALVAIKKANAHLAKLGTDWESILRGKVKIIADPFASINIPQAHVNPNRNEDYKPRAPARPQPQAPAPPPQPAYKPPPPRRPTPSPVKPKPGHPAFSGDIKEKTIVNKHDGTCTRCKNRVLAGDGVAILWSRPDHSTYWTSEHTGTCPSTVRKHRPVSTSDDFQI